MYWESFINLLKETRFEALNFLKLQIDFGPDSYEACDWIKHLRPWLVFNDTMMRNIGMKGIQISFRYLCPLVMSGRMRKFCKENQKKFDEAVKYQEDAKLIREKLCELGYNSDISGLISEFAAIRSSRIRCAHLHDDLIMTYSYKI